MIDGALEARQGSSRRGDLCASRRNGCGGPAKPPDEEAEEDRQEEGHLRFITIVYVGGAGPMKPVAPARRPADVEDGGRVDRGMRPCADGSRYWPGRRIRTTSRRINTNSMEAFCSIILSFGSEPTAMDQLQDENDKDATVD